ncbi:MAG: hypothetical protein WBE91_01770 [Steroidobacteraceae bacterium]
MNHMLRNWTMIAAAGLLALVTLSACVATGYDGGPGFGYVGGYYEPAGYDVGGWGPGYRVGPPRGAVRGRGAPSIPHAARGGGHATGSRPKR